MRQLFKKIAGLTFLLLAFFQHTSAQDQLTPTLYGFVRSDFFFDSRLSKTGIQDLFCAYPMYSKLNSDGEDLNAVTSSGLNSVTTRLGVKLKGQGIWGASSSQSAIETDFCGAPNYWTVRIRQAYVQLKWAKTDLLVGQTWHPLFTASYMPSVLSLNTGAPFQPFNRSPQIRLDKQLAAFKWSAAGVWQMMYTSAGPLGTSYVYQRNALMPELYTSLEYKNGRTVVGLGLDFKAILPERYINDADGISRINQKRLYTPTIMAYSQYNGNKLVVRGKALLGQNLTDQNLIGGYAITPDHDYVPFNTFTSFVNLVAGNTHQWGIYTGFSANLGAASTLPDNSQFYGFGVEDANTASEKMVASMIRLAPAYSYNVGNWKVGAELELTSANWANRMADGSLNTFETVWNKRLYAIVMYLL